MIVGSYQLDLYCDLDADMHGGPVVHPYRPFPVQYTGENERECLRQARRSGWRFHLKERPQRAICPQCNRQRANP